ncbi:MAG: poly polymerase catalytic domain-containing protein [Benjaminiella poitrasii]|nr:MAG: poly polymerase catalytic domain-containing protein [Benjaminiella poitrasii]
MLKAGANPNIYGPNSEPENGMSCFMYNVSLGSIKNQELLLKYNVDLDLVDPHCSRTIFYEAFFSIMNPTERKFSSDENIKRFSFESCIYQEMLKTFKPNVNIIDCQTGMTPLELAVLGKNAIITERLLSLGSNPNIESCGHATKIHVQHIQNPSMKKLPAFLYAVILSDLKTLTVICEKSIEKINWMWLDDEGNNIFSYMLGVISGYSSLKLPIFKYVASQIGTEGTKYLLRIKNKQGISPVLFAYHNKNNGIYDILISVDSSLETFIIDNYDAKIFDFHDQFEPMDIDYITTLEVDEAAQIEREILQRQKDIEILKDKNTQVNTSDAIAEVDPYSKLEKIGYLVLDDNHLPYDIMLMKVELRSWGDYTDTSFYKLSIIYNKILDVYILWTRWGPFGREGQHQKTPFFTKEKVVDEFKSIFKAKTGNAWGTHHDSFEVKPGRYEIMHKADHPKDVIVDNFGFLESKVPTELPFEIFNLMKLICNYHYLSRVYSDTNVDMPLGQIPQSRIEKARTILKDTLEMINIYNELRKNYSDKSKTLESKVYQHKIAQKCVEYSRILPRSNDSNQAIRSLYDYNNTAITSEMSKVDDLGYIGFAANIILAAKHYIESINPLDYAYRTLNCFLKVITPDTDFSEYQLVRHYAGATVGERLELVNLFAVDRPEESIRFKPYENSQHRKLLWHGSRIGNFMGILKQGLRSTPAVSNYTGSLLGNGVYFADMVSKSLQYAKETYENKSSSAYMILLLCEVALDIFQDDIENQKDGVLPETRKGQGELIPNPENELYDMNRYTIGSCCSL